MAFQEQSGGQGMEPNMNFSPRQAEIPLPSGLEAGIGFGVTSLVLGLMSIPLAIIVIGAGTGLLGLIFAIIHLARRLPFKGLAIAGLVLSLIGTAAGTGMGVVYGINIHNAYKTASEYGGEFENYYGTEAPDVTLNTIDGDVIKLSDLKGKRVLLDFWATWCGPCKQEIPHLIELRKTTSPDELVIIGISAEPKEIIQKFAANRKMNYPLVSTRYDTEMPEPFNKIYSIPTLFVIDANGLIESTAIGYQSLEKLRQKALGITPAEEPTEQEDI